MCLVLWPVYENSGYLARLNMSYSKKAVFFFQIMNIHSLFGPNHVILFSLGSKNIDNYLSTKRKNNRNNILYDVLYIQLFYVTRWARVVQVRGKLIDSYIF